MENRCRECGYQNEPYASKCSKCGTSFEHIINEKKRSMKEFRVFSIIYLITSAIGTGDFIYRYVFAGQFSYGIFSNVPSVNPGQVQSAITPLLYIFEIIAGVSAIITLVSIYFLRNGFKILAKEDRDFSTPVTGTTLIFVGLIMVIVALLIVVALLVTMLPGLLQPTPTFNLASLATLAGVGFLVVIGAIIFLAGIIMGMLIGLHRLAVVFDEGMFDAAWILYLISFFFSPIGLVAAYLSYAGTKKTERRLDASVSSV